VGVNEADLTGVLREHASRYSVPGAALGVLRHGETTCAYCGVADARTAETVGPKTRFSVGSLTKSMVATVVAHLAEAGRLSFDDPIAAHLPELPSHGWVEHATLRDLLANRSGLPLRSALEFGFDLHTDLDDGALSRLVADVGADSQPAGFWSYTNVGWCLLGRVIETATGTTWEDAMQRHLVEKAGMRETSFKSWTANPLRVSGHEVRPSGPVAVEPLVARAYGPAGTSAVSTITDVLRFAALHLSDRSLDGLRIAHTEDVSIYGWFDSWCLGWARFGWDGGQGWWWDGLINGERSFLRIMPERQAAIALLTNASTGRALYRALFPDLMEAVSQIRIPELRLDPLKDGAGDLGRFAGVYAWPDHRVAIKAAGSGLLITTEGGTREALPLSDRVFLIDAEDPDNPTITFGSFDAAGRPHVLYQMLWGLPRLDQETGAVIQARP
jgi:CubicO group peptidase (beta-lactamase class C family)